MSVPIQSSTIRAGLAAAAVSLALAGCGASGITALAADGGWGGSVSLRDGDSVQIGTALWCVDGDEPAEVSGVEFEELQGIEIVDFAVVTQPIIEDRLGSAEGPLGTDLPGRADRQIHGQCADFDEDGNAPDDTEISYVVLELRLTEGQSVGTAKGLRVQSDAGSAVDLMKLVLCDEDAVAECDPDLEALRILDG